MSARRHGAGRQAEPEQANDAELSVDRADPGAGDASVGPAGPDAAGEPDPAAPQTSDYTRAGGHVLTDYGWVLEERIR